MTPRPPRRPRALAPFAGAALAALALAACGELTKDSTFRLWCGESLCAWGLEAGSVRRAPTWHAKDYGVELVEAPTTISQSTPASAACLAFTMIADVDPGAQVSVGLDFNRDGSVDYEQPIASTGFREARTVVTAPERYDGVRFVISKKGEGRAVLAQMRVESSGDCAAPPIEPTGLRLGSGCEGDGQCLSGVCCEHLCADCCGAYDSPEAVVEPGPPARVTRPCAGGGACERRGDDARLGVGAAAGEYVLEPVTPLQCDPGRRARPAGAECLSGDDCASGACDGAVARPVGGGEPACETNPFDADGPCELASVLGGRCG